MSANIQDELTARAVHALLAELVEKKYNHWCPTPETQELTIKKRVALAKLDGEDVLQSKNIHDIWAWSLPVSPTIAAKLHSSEVLSLLKEAGVLVPQSGNDLLVPTIRVSNLYPQAKGANLYVHSTWPTTDVDAAFFGPDSYRYTRYLGSLTKRIPNAAIAIDMCTGPGVGAIHLAREFPNAEVYGLDINPKALKLAEINAKHLLPTSHKLKLLYSDAYSAVADNLTGKVDIIAIDPPFIADDNRTYAQGGYLGIEFTLDMLRKSRPLLREGGEAWLHMAAPITFEGKDVFREEIEKLEGWEVAEYEIIDVDIFGNEMENIKTYPGIGAIASVGLVFKKVGN